MRCHQQQVRVELDYPVYFTRDVFAAENPVLVSALARREPSRRHRCLFVVDSGVAEAWPSLDARIAAYVSAHAARVERLGSLVVVPGGEAAKNDPATVAELHQLVDSLRIDRQSFIVGIGGGAALDMIGYAAATAHRGVRMVRLPTTVLGQNDSGVGVKNSINAFGKKNFLGTFAAPFAVVNDALFLPTLAARDRRAGMAEALKVALIRDAEFFAWISDNATRLGQLELDPLEVLIERCALLHLQHIAGGGDPFEQGAARPLDFGHWSAHKLEALTSYDLRHGEAVSVGIALDTRYAVLAGLLPEAVGQRILQVQERLGLPTYHPALDWVDPQGRWQVLAGLQEFREHLGGELTVTLIRDIGQGLEVNTLDPDLLRAAANWLKQRTTRAATSNLLL